MALAVLYCFARSGGTLVNRCLGAMPGNLVLSEVNPHGAVMPIEVQARDWLGLLPADEAGAFREQPYAEQIRALAAAAAGRGRHLVLRDWPSLNFVDGLYFPHHHASGLLEQDLYLRAHGLACPSAVVARRAAAVYASIVRTFGHLRRTPSEFGASYLAYARAVAGRPIVRFEDLCRAPCRELARLCAALGVAYSDAFVQDFAAFDRCTGDNLLPVPSRAGRSTRVEVVAEPEGDPAWIAAQADPSCREADAMFGYP
jgi:hypothetical protein